MPCGAVNYLLVQCIPALLGQYQRFDIVHFHQPRHAVGVILVQMRQHQQVYPVPAAAVQISRREVARVGEVIGVAAVYHHRCVSGKGRDALPLTDVQHAYRVGVPVKLPVRNKQRRQC